MPWTHFSQQTDFVLSEQDAARGGDRDAIDYAAAVNETLDYALTHDNKFFVMGQGVNDAGGLFGTTKGLHQKHGTARVFDTPLSENALTGVAIGAALTGMRPFYIHNRPDFLLMAMDQIVNHAAKWNYMFGGGLKLPLVIWTVTARGWGSAAQHSQALQGLFLHVPGLKVVMPTTPYDSKGLIVSAIADNNPVLILEHRWLMKQQGQVPQEMYSVPIGKGIVRRKGADVSFIAASHMVLEALKAAEQLEREGISAEVIDIRSIKPLDTDLIVASVKKTGRAVVADTGWLTGGVTAEIAAQINERAFKELKAPVRRVACPDVPTPASDVLERAFYPDSERLVQAVHEIYSYEG